MDIAEIADKFASAFPDWQVEMIPTEDAYKLAPIWPPKFDYWAMLENKLGEGFTMSPTPPNAYWHHAGNEHMPIPTIYQHHYSTGEYPTAQQVEQAQSCLHKISSVQQCVYTAWLSSNEPALRWKAIEALNA